MIPLGLRLALRHLTVLPLAADAREEHASPVHALLWFPLTGALIGAFAAAMLALPLPALPRAALALAAWAALTGALHEDAWMDSADAALAIATRERRHEILKDPHVGAHAVTALAIALLLRFSALGIAAWIAPIVAALCGRWMMVLTLAHFRAARTDGLGARFARDARAWPATAFALVMLCALSAAGGARVLLAGAVALTVGGVMARWLSVRFGGLSGDGHGAAGYAAETAALVAMVVA